MRHTPIYLDCPHCGEPSAVTVFNGVATCQKCRYTPSRRLDELPAMPMDVFQASAEKVARFIVRIEDPSWELI